MNILVTTDKNYLPHTYVMLISLLENNADTCVDLYYVHDDLDDRSIDRFKRFFSRFNMTATFLKYDSSVIKQLRIGYHFTKATYLRIVSPDILPESIDRILYLDPDIVVTRSLADLYHTNLGDRFLGAVVGTDLENERHIALNMPYEYDYFNSGVMVIDLEKFRSNNISKRVMDYAIENNERLVLCDQDALNAVLYDKCLPVHPRWNVRKTITSTDRYQSGTLPVEVLEAISDPGIIHFEGTEKPWQPFCDHPLRGLYWHYLKQTPFRYSGHARYWLRYTLWKPKNLTGRLLRALIVHSPTAVQRLIPRALKHRLRIGPSGRV